MPLDTMDPLLENLAEDLRGTLHVIAHAGYHSNLEFIRERQEWLKGKYGHLVSEGIYFRTKGDFTSVGLAYSSYMSILEKNLSPEEILREGEDILYQYLGEEGEGVWVLDLKSDLSSLNFI